MSLEVASLSQLKADLEVKLRAQEASLEGALKENERVRGVEIRTGEECLMLRRALDKASFKPLLYLMGLDQERMRGRGRAVPSFLFTLFPLS